MDFERVLWCACVRSCVRPHENIRVLDRLKKNHLLSVLSGQVFLSQYQAVETLGGSTHDA